MDKNVVGAVAIIVVIIALVLGVMEFYKIAWALIAFNAVFLVTIAFKNRD